MNRFEKAAMDFIDSKQDEMLGLLGELVSFNSVKGDPSPGRPYGDEVGKCLETALKRAGELGFATENVDGYMGAVDAGGNRPHVAILAHLDIVGAGVNWDTDPFTLTLKDGKLYGRGTSDDKGGAVASLYAMLAAQNSGIKLNRGVRLLLGTDEESGMTDLVYYRSKYDMPTYTLSPDGGFPIINTEKGRFASSFEGSAKTLGSGRYIAQLDGGYRVNVVPPEASALVMGISQDEIRQCADKATKLTGAEFEITSEQGGVRILAKGTGGHAAAPHNGLNAITALLEVVGTLGLDKCELTTVLEGLWRLYPHGDYGAKAIGIDCEDEVSGPLTMSLAVLNYDGKTVRGQFDSRLPVCANSEKIVSDTTKKFGELGLELKETRTTAPHNIPDDSELVRTLLGTYTDVTGNEGYTASMGGGTYVHGIPGGVCFGAVMPGRDAAAHMANESMVLDDFMACAKIYALAIMRLCGEQAL